MATWAVDSRSASRRCSSLTCRCTSGTLTLRRSGRGGKSPAWPTRASALSALPLAPDQETVRQHHRRRMAMEARPQPPLILIPTQLPFGLLMELLDPVTPVRVFHHLRQRHLWTKVAPKRFPALALAPRLTLPDQPTTVPLTVAGHPPTPQRDEPPAQPLLAPLPPTHRPPRRGRQGLQDRIDPLGRRRAPAEGHGEIAPDRDHIVFATLLKAGQEVRVVSVVGVGHYLKSAFRLGSLWTIPVGTCAI